MAKFSILLVVSLLLGIVLVIPTYAQDTSQGELIITDGFGVQMKFLQGGGTIAVHMDALSCYSLDSDCLKGCDQAQGTCAGFVGDRPDYRVEWRGHGSPPEFVYVGDGDPILVVNETTRYASGTHGYSYSTTYYNDDYVPDTANPGIGIIPKPPNPSIEAYVYYIWIGTKVRGAATSGVLHIVEGGNYPDYSILGTYYMDQMTHRVITISLGTDYLYRIEEQTSPWPWEGVGLMIGNHFSGYADFLESDARMSIDGEVNRDGTITLEYYFLTEEGRFADRIDPHVWFPAD